MAFCGPFGTSASVRDDGTEGTAGDLIGYTIVEADDLAAAKALTDGLPFLSNSDGKMRGGDLRTAADVAGTVRRTLRRRCGGPLALSAHPPAWHCRRLSTAPPPS